jgi:hypothetical protein
MPNCAECGFLAARNNQSRQLEEVESIFRETGKPAIIVNEQGVLGLGSSHESQPLCFAQAYNLRREFMETTHEKYPIYDAPDKESIATVLHKDRECASFLPWQQGFTPKEHREMIDRERFEERQAKREEADRRWRSRQDLKLVFIAGAFTILGGLLAYFFGGCN